MHVAQSFLKIRKEIFKKLLSGLWPVTEESFSDNIFEYMNKLFFVITNQKSGGEHPCMHVVLFP